MLHFIASVEAQVAQAITILVGTMTGTAELVAEEVSERCQGAGFSPSTILMDRADTAVLAAGGVFLIVSSTYGNGDVPDNAQALFEGLSRERPDLSRVVYGVIALGDMTYRATFCHGGLRFDRLLTELGARRAGEPLTHDASSGSLAEVVACDWADAWIQTELSPALAA